MVIHGGSWWLIMVIIGWLCGWFYGSWWLILLISDGLVVDFVVDNVVVFVVVKWWIIWYWWIRLNLAAAFFHVLFVLVFIHDWLVDEPVIFGVSLTVVRRQCLMVGEGMGGWVATTVIGADEEWWQGWWGWWLLTKKHDQNWGMISQWFLLIGHRNDYCLLIVTNIS